MSAVQATSTQLAGTASAVQAQSILGAAATEAVELGVVEFSANGLSGAIAEASLVSGEHLVLRQFTIRSFAGGLDLLGPLRALVGLAQAQGAATITFVGEVVNPALAARLGIATGSEFAFTVAANMPALLRLLRALNS